MEDEQSLTDRMYNPAFEEKKRSALPQEFRASRMTHTEEIPIEAYQKIIRQVFAWLRKRGVDIDPIVHEFLESDIARFSPIDISDKREKMYKLELAWQFDWKQRRFLCTPDDMQDNPGLEIPTLQMGDITKFMEKLREFVRAVREAKQADDNRALKMVEYLCFNFTPLDFDNPLVAIDRAIAILYDNSFTEFSQTKKVGSLESIGYDLSLTRTNSGDEYESPHALAPELTPLGKVNVHSEAGYLPLVRYAITKDQSGTKRGIVYAVQNRQTSIKSLEDLEQLRRDLEIDMERTGRYLQTQYKVNRTQFDRVFGAIPPEIAGIADPKEFCIAFAAHLKQNSFALYSMEEWNWFQSVKQMLSIPEREISNSILHHLSLYTSNLIRAANYADYKTALDDPLKEKRQLMKKLYKIDTGVLDQESDEYRAYHREQQERATTKIDLLSEEEMPDNIYEVYQGAIVSLLTTLVLFKKQGITDVDVPTYLPMRWQHHASMDDVRGIENATEAERIQRSTTDKFIRTFSRIGYHIDGLELDYSFVDQGLLKVKLTPGHWTANNPILQEIIDVAEKSQFGTV